MSNKDQKMLLLFWLLCPAPGYPARSLGGWSGSCATSGKGKQTRHSWADEPEVGGISFHGTPKSGGVLGWLTHSVAHTAWIPLPDPSLWLRLHTAPWASLPRSPLCPSPDVAAALTERTQRLYSIKVGVTLTAFPLS